MRQKQDPLAARLNPAQRARLHAVLCEQEIKLVSCVYWRDHAGWSVPWRSCPDSFLLIPTRGGFRVTLEEQGVRTRPRLVRAGEYLMLSEGRRHFLAVAAELGPLEQISVHVHIADAWGRPLLARFPQPFGRLRDRRARWDDLRDVTSLLHHDPETGRARGEWVLREILLERARDDDGFALEVPGSDPRIATALEAMHRGLGSPSLGIDQLARQVALSPVQFRKLFRQGLGRSPKAHLQHLRLQRAARLLLRTSQTVRGVAGECGFASDHYFHLVFREAFAMTPSEYRAQGLP